MKNPLSWRRTLLVLVAVGVIGPCSAMALGRVEEAVIIPPPTLDASPQAERETAVFAGGCFWGVQGVFQHVKGVKNAVSGYAGGTPETAHYARVSSGNTEHAEAVEVTFDPRQVSYGTLLHIFFSVAHNPTELNRQGPDTGTQYRSALFTKNAEQHKVAQAYITQLDAGKSFSKPIVTQLQSYNGFYPAEEEHQDFLTEHPSHPYIVINDLPKVAQLEQLFPDRYQDNPVLVNARR